MPRYKLLALDLDGTLLDAASRVTAENAHAVHRAQRAGVQVALCTGRNLSDTRVFSDQLLAPADWAATANGADVRRTSDERCIFSAGLDRARCEVILDVCAEFHSDPCFYTSEKLYYGRSFLGFLQEIRARGGIALDETAEGYYFIDGFDAWRDLLQRETEPVTKAILDHKNPQIVDLMKEALQKTGLFEVAPSTMYGGALKNIEVNRRGVDKGTGLKALAETLGLGMDAVMAIGDSDNDLSMLKQAGLGVAMANAAPHIRRAAAVCTGSNTQNGVALAIKQYLLEESA